MKFVLLDRIVALSPGERIRAVKAVTATEEYLADHFPSFPVLPGVLMLEALAEAASWLVRVSQDFACSIVLRPLRIAKRFERLHQDLFNRRRSFFPRLGRASEGEQRASDQNVRMAESRHRDECTQGVPRAEGS